MPVISFLCPICNEALTLLNHAFHCANNHQFDVAKEGYANLLPVQFKKSKMPGDNPDMVMARRRFLASGQYEFLQEALIQSLLALQPASILDMGCGEGYYTNAIAEALPNADVIGVDISKSAVKYASKRAKSNRYLVASSANVPLPDHQLAAIVVVFAPVLAPECHRLLKLDGKLFTVTPGPNHLIELKRHIYKDVKLHELPSELEGFHLNGQQLLVNQTVLAEPQLIADLIDMTPFGWKVQPDTKQRLMACENLSITIEFVLSEYIAVDK